MSVQFDRFQNLLTRTGLVIAIFSILICHCTARSPDVSSIWNQQGPKNQQRSQFGVNAGIHTDHHYQDDENDHHIQAGIHTHRHYQDDENEHHIQAEIHTDHHYQRGQNDLHIRRGQNDHHNQRGQNDRHNQRSQNDHLNQRGQNDHNNQRGQNDYHYQRSQNDYHYQRSQNDHHNQRGQNDPHNQRGQNDHRIQAGFQPNSPPSRSAPTEDYPDDFDEDDIPEQPKQLGELLSDVVTTGHEVITHGIDRFREVNDKRRRKFDNMLDKGFGGFFASSKDKNRKGGRGGLL